MVKMVHVNKLNNIIKRQSLQSTVSARVSEHVTYDNYRHTDRYRTPVVVSLCSVGQLDLDHDLDLDH